ncbi:amidohydrolase, partial [Streptomyces sp. MK37H]|nr:amidohydrolase [Streptomyces sp. MK37H]
MTYIALEEAFIIPELFSRQPSSPQKIQVSDQYVKDWGRRLGDFEEHRLPEMDAHGIDIQILSLSVPGIQADTDAGAAVDN